MIKSNRLKIGDGLISGYLAIFLGVVGLGFVITAYNPSLFTTEDFRALYSPNIVKTSILVVLILAFGFAITSVILRKKSLLAFISVLLIGATVLLGTGLPENQDIVTKTYTIGMDWLFIDILLSAIIFIPIELFLPKRLSQSKFHSEWRTDLVYFIISHLLIQIIGLIIHFPSVTLFKNVGLIDFQATIQSIHFIPQLFLVLLVSDLFQYSAHYFFHKIPFLWRFHAIHHSTKHLDWLAGSRTHFVDLVVVRSISFIPLYAFGFSNDVFITYVIIVSIQAVLAHANTRINFGFLKYVFVTPQFHHWHHSDNPEAFDKNFSIHFPFIDMIFGTYFDKGKEWTERTGLGEQVVVPKGYLKQFLIPFYKNPQDDSGITDKSER
jgi:sterol desaturase/sphingolipid hydroxylase (fatty acid hydroxylase superfamily)